MTEMAKSMGGMPGMAGGGAAGGKKPSAEEAAKMMENLTPDQMKSMAESQVDGSKLKEMAKAAGMDMPDINPEMMAQAAEQMGLSPERER